MATQSLTSEFDPTSIGATPVSQASPSPASSGQEFDPTSIGATPVQPQAASPGGIGGVGKWLANTASSIEQPFVSLAATPVQLLAKAAGFPDPYAEGMPGFPGSDNKISIAPATSKGFLQKAGQLGQVASYALTPESAGFQGILKMGLLGGAGGGATALANGADLNLNPFGEGEMPHAMRQGALFSGILGALGNAARIVSGSEKMASGIDPAMEHELAQTRPSTLAKYINTAKNSAADFHSPTVSDTLDAELRSGVGILQKKVLPILYKAKDEALKTSGNSPLIYQAGENAAPNIGVNAVASVKDEINTAMQQMTGHQFTDYSAGEAGALDIKNYPQGPTTHGLGVDESNITPIPGRSVEMASKDQRNLEMLHRQLETLAQNPTVQTAADVIKNLDAKIDWRSPTVGEGSTPVDGLMRYARGTINRTIAPAAPDLAAVNNRLGQLADVEHSLAKGAGKDLEHLDLLARRTLYDGQSDKAQSVLDGLFNAVKGHLPPGEESYTTKAIIARFAKDTFGGKTAQTGFAQGMSSGDAGSIASGYTGKVVSAGLRAAKRVLAPNPEQHAMSISKGEPYSFVPMAHHIDEFLDSPASAPWLKSFKEGLKSIGVSSSHVGQSSKDALRMMMFNNLMQASDPAPDPSQRQLTP